MTLKNIVGIDHAVVIVRDLDQAAENWKRLGFTISPRGTHSAHMGTGNYTIMLDPDYIELLGVLAPTEHNALTRALLEKREGIERVAFTTSMPPPAPRKSAPAAAPIGPTDFERPVTMPDGAQSAAKFRTFHWPVAEAPAGMRIFACQHKTRETVWIPELMRHANGAKHLKQVLLVAPEPAKEAAHLARLIDARRASEADGAIAVPSGADRADFVFMSREQLGRRHPGVPLAGLPERGAHRARNCGRSRRSGEGARCYRLRSGRAFACRRRRRTARCSSSPLDRSNRSVAAPLLPAVAFELGIVVLFLGPAETEIGDEAPTRRQVEHGARGIGIEDRDPADAESFSARGEPQVWIAATTEYRMVSAWSAARGHGPARWSRPRTRLDAPAPATILRA